MPGFKPSKDLYKPFPSAFCIPCPRLPFQTLKGSLQTWIIKKKDGTTRTSFKPSKDLYKLISDFLKHRRETKFQTLKGSLQT
ncbi:MAG: hypothetical protein MjAS7_1972 [Metallosphaera javensis (ex Sakai et al. 2022)]|nr:MAG: hypothetical protein MjAS7_1972 [Metallosphaera javensis (ex Sakai et al. 2022)]